MSQQKATYKTTRASGQSLQKYNLPDNDYSIHPLNLLYEEIQTARSASIQNQTTHPSPRAHASFSYHISHNPIQLHQHMDDVIQLQLPIRKQIQHIESPHTHTPKSAMESPNIAHEKSPNHEYYSTIPQNDHPLYETAPN